MTNTLIRKIKITEKGWKTKETEENWSILIWFKSMMTNLFVWFSITEEPHSKAYKKSIIGGIVRSYIVHHNQLKSQWLACFTWVSHRSSTIYWSCHKHIAGKTPYVDFQISWIESACYIALERDLWVLTEIFEFFEYISVANEIWEHPSKETIRLAIMTDFCYNTSAIFRDKSEFDICWFEISSLKYFLRFDWNVIDDVGKRRKTSRYVYANEFINLMTCWWFDNCIRSYGIFTGTYVFWPREAMKNIKRIGVSVINKNIFRHRCFYVQENGW